MKIEIQDHSAKVSAEIKAALLRGLEKIRLVAEAMRRSRGLIPGLFRILAL